MALLFMDGFDHYGSGANPSISNKWLVGTGSPGTSNGAIRTGTFSLRAIGVTFVMTTKVLTTSGGAVVGMAYYNALAFSATNLIEIVEGAIVHVAVAITTGGLLTVKRGTTVLATGTTVLSINNWYYIELKATISDTGSYEVRIDGVTEAALTNAGPVDTQNAGTGTWDRITLGGGVASSASYIDDFYVCDTSGSAPRNTFLGMVKVETMYPSTGNGTNTGLTCSTGSDHGALVDETTPNTTDYNSGSTVGLKDTYNYPAMTLTGTVLGIQTNLYCMKADAGARSVCGVIRSGGADYDGANASPLTSWTYLSEIRAQNPNGNIEWTTATVGTLEAGMKITV